MKINLLFIANIFPPMGGSGVQRSAKFIKYLSEFDVTPFVLTREFEKGIMDNTLLNEIPKGTSITRTKAYDYTQFPGIMSYAGKVIARKLLIPDGEVTWYKKSLHIARKMIKDNNIQVIYSTSYPYSDHLLAAELKKEFPNIPWVADFRDEWSMNPYIIDKGYSSSRTAKEKSMEEMIATNCDHFVANTWVMHENFLAMYPCLKDKSSVITNGFDSDDFIGLSKEYVPNDKFVIVHPGVIYGNRKIDKILKALLILEKEGKIDKSKVKLRLIGDIKVDAIMSEAELYNGTEYIDCPGYLDHRSIIKELVSAEVLLLILREGSGGRNIAPGKIYEYINSNRRILALAPKDGVAAGIINDTKTGIVCDTINVEEIKDGIYQMYQQWQQNEFTFKPVQEEIMKYDRKELTRKLAAVIHGLLNK